jgi:hypothetical protein
MQVGGVQVMSGFALCSLHTGTAALFGGLSTDGDMLTAASFRRLLLVLLGVAL